jgi:CelD/BcsL family acetyltransferase involved in cellulose biosynthesis
MLHYEYITNLAAFDDYRDAWNSLWYRSRSHVCNDRHEIVSLIARHAASPNNFRAIIVLDDAGQAVAALPFFFRQRRILKDAARCLGNPSSPLSTLLVDPSTSRDELWPCLFGGLRSNKIETVRLEWCNLEWAEQIGLSQASHAWSKKRFDVGQIDLSQCGDIRTSISKNYRKNLQRWKNGLSKIGKLDLRCIDPSDHDAMKEAFKDALNVDHTSWKGPEGTSILSSGAQTNYWTEWFATLTGEGLARIFLLTLDDQPIAADVGYIANHVFSSVKISYVESMAQYGLGHVRDQLLIEHLTANTDVKWIDGLGPCDEIKWPQRRYPLGKLTFSTGSLLGQGQIQVQFGLAALKGLMKSASVADAGLIK